jgi:hypothetical protein
MAQNEQINIDLIINASQSAKTLKEQKQSLKDIREGLDNVKQGSGAFELLTDEANRLTASMNTLTLSFEDVYGEGVQPLTTQLGELEDRMYALAIAGQKDSEEFRTLQAEAIKMRKTIIDVDETVDAFAQKGAKLRGFIGIAQGITGAFGVAKGTLSLFGVENDNLEKSLQQTAVIIEVLSGLEAVNTAIKEKNVIVSGIQNGIKKAAVFITSELAVAEAAQAVAAGTATTAQIALNAAMNANPIGLLITAVVALTTAFALFGSSSDKATESQEKLAESIKKTKTEANFEIEVFKSQIEALKSLKTGSEERAILIDKINNKYGTTLQNLSDENKFLKQIKIAQDDYVKGATRRLNIKINEQKAEAFLGQAQELRFEKEEKIADKRRLLAEGYTKTDPLILAINRDIKDLEKVALGYQAKAQKQLEVNAKLLTKETAQEKAIREKADKEAKDAEAKRIADLNKLNDKTSNKTISDTKEKQKELRDIQIKALIEEYNINKEAAEKLFKLKTEENNDLKEKQLELLDAEYADEYNKLIEQANQKSVDDLNKSLELKLISIEQYTVKREEIEKNGFKNLTDAEKTYLNEFKTNTDNKKAIIIKSFNDEAQITKDETALINSELVLAQIEHNKEIELLNAESLGNDIDINKAKSDILQKYLDIQIKAIQANSDNELKVLQNSYNKDISNVSLTAEEKIQIEAKYNSDKFNIIKDTENQITDETKKSADAQKQNTRELISNISDFASALVSEISSLFNSISQGFVDANISQIESQKEQALKAYDEQTAAYSEMNSNMSNADRLKADKEKAIQVERDKLEAEYDEKRKQAEYEGALRSWRMSLAQAVVDGASFILKSGAQTGFFGIPAASILTAFQVGTILANPPQKFATGGYVSGEGGATDDKIPAMLSNGEFVINAAATSNNLPLLNMINAGATPMEAAIPTFATGGQVNVTNNLPLLNMINAGATPMTPSIPTFATGGQVNVTNNNNMDLTDMVRIFEQYMSQPIKAYVVGNDVTQQQNKDNRLKSRTSF